MNRLLLFALLSLMVASCATTRTGRVIDQGEASWYGPGFHGKKTANGEIYNQNELTAAHRTLPFNTVVRVVNLNNNKSVTVRINDRGPYARGRIIDLSREAARKIDMLDSGIAPVRLVLVSSEKPIRTRGPGNIRREEFTIQLASFNSRPEAEAYSSQVRGSRVTTGQVDGRQVYRVYFGRYRSSGEASRDLNRLKRRGHDGYIRQVQN
ncbi:septal ring lytic transglycosylase RlpA family protein [Balneolales bacterium ANBcel1]|nr:septal ring lytic transglycosylase RlpA family protein [Balneolales bacterium ANBcel1]